MDSEISIRIVLVDPPADVDFGIQRGSGHDYEALFVQQRSRGDIVFDFSMTVSDERKEEPNLRRPFAQGPPAKRFVYVDVGTYAGQKNTPWSRRIKVPLTGITWPLIKKAQGQPGSVLVANIPGRGKDGSPSCATVPILGGWQLASAKTSHPRAATKKEAHG